MEGHYMKKHFFFLITLLFVLSGCSKNDSKEIIINNPYEIAKGETTLSYYDTEDKVSIDGFNIIENTIQNFQDKNNNIIINDDGEIRCITIVDNTVKTFKSISVGDSVNKIEESFDNEYQNGNNYMVIFNNDIEEDPANPDKENTWVWITYFTDESKITSIQIYDVKYGSELK